MKKRYVITSLLMTASAIATPFAIHSAYETRGYMAYGGEYLIVPLAAVAASFILDIAREWDKAKAGNTASYRCDSYSRSRICKQNNERRGLLIGKCRYERSQQKQA